MIFTTWTKEINQELNKEMNNTKIPLDKNPKILGVTLVPTLSFAQHSKITCAKVSSKNNAIRRLAGTDWGCSKETLLCSYKTISRSVINYAAPVWTPSLSTSRWNDLQVKQNSALRTVTGCVQMTSIDHLHHEASMMKVKEHNEMISAQFLAGAYNTNRPDHFTSKPSKSPRTIKNTLHFKFGEDIERLQETHSSAKEIKDIIHKEAALKAKYSYKSDLWPIGVENVEISNEETKLPRSTRRILAQLRSKYSSHLNSFNSRINDETENKCELCNGTPHDTSHLFNCPSNPTQLEAIDLWLKPVEVAAFLGLDQ